MNIKKLIEKSEEQGFIAQLEAKTRHTYNLKIFNQKNSSKLCFGVGLGLLSK
jgi:hypothetical protein